MRLVTPAIQRIGHRRESSWWEPIYKPGLHGSLTICDWDFSSNTGPKSALLDASLMKHKMSAGDVYKLSGLTFTDCDFQGAFSHEPSILLDQCRFIGCDFAFSKWTRTSFRRCHFDHCSIALTEFSECEFRECEWSSIGFSGNRTLFDRTFLTKPRKLLRAGVSGHDPARKDSWEHRSYQRFRLEGTRAHIARTLLLSHELVGDDQTYYETAGLHDRQQAFSKFSEGLYTLAHAKGYWNRIRFVGPLYWLLEVGYLFAFGLINGWGQRFLLPLLLLIASALGMAAVYHSFFPSLTPLPLQKSFDLALLAGFTNEVTTSQPPRLRALEYIQLATSILLYTVFFSTMVARISRSR